MFTQYLSLTAVGLEYFSQILPECSVHSQTSHDWSSILAQDSPLTIRSEGYFMLNYKKTK